MTSYEASEVFKRVEESISIMEKRAEQINAEVAGLEKKVQAVKKEMGDRDEKLADAYLAGIDLESDKGIEKIQSLMGLDLSGIRERYMGERKSLEKELSKLESNRMVMMQEAMAKDDQGAFRDSRLTLIQKIELDEGYHVLHSEGFISGKHRRGLLYFRHRWLQNVAEETARGLGYDSFSQMMNSQWGLKELRNSIPILTLYPEMTVDQVEIEVAQVSERYAKVADRVAHYVDRFTDYVTEELMRQFNNLSYSNLMTRLSKHGSKNSEAIEGILSKQVKLEESQNLVLQDISNLEKERSSISRKMGEYSEMLVEMQHFKRSSKPIESKYVDKLFAAVPYAVAELPRADTFLEDVLRQYPLEKLDKAVRAANPTATQYHIKDARVTYTSRSSDPGLYDKVRNQGGRDGNWTKPRRIR